ncbi:hypothetical protein BDM02DRAFT_3155854 [Thelephora ganbajun]|uniref:Uncharacterized protein n=1 Tax=Thelephora ganbajun TaxID=370292 RepID=A0ACB6ZEL3_THEGA|nr:hypothetical protein BDM02DRAFT_3155854 [Thelephora ganbajun]
MDFVTRLSDGLARFPCYAQLVGVYICLGVAETGLFPGVVYCLTLWYSRHKPQYRIGLFFGAASVSGAFSGLLAFGISFMSASVPRPDQFALPESIGGGFSPTAGFLTPKEKNSIVWTKNDFSVGGEENFEFRHIKLVLLDWQMTHTNAMALTTLSGAPSVMDVAPVLLFFAHCSDKLRLRRSFILSCLVSNPFLGVCLRHEIIIDAFTRLGHNLAGQCKRGVGMALRIETGNLSGVISSTIYRTRDSPRYIIGHGTELTFVGIGLVVLPIILFTYKRINARRDAVMSEKGGLQYSDRGLRRMGDRAPDFRYTL